MRKTLQASSLDVSARTSREQGAAVKLGAHRTSAAASPSVAISCASSARSMASSSGSVMRSVVRSTNEKAPASASSTAEVEAAASWSNATVTMFRAMAYRDGGAQMTLARPASSQLCRAGASAERMTTRAALLDSSAGRWTLECRVQMHNNTRQNNAQHQALGPSQIGHASKTDRDACTMRLGVQPCLFLPTRGRPPASPSNSPNPLPAEQRERRYSV